MKVVFTFDEAATAAAGYKIGDVRYTVKKEFADRGLPCVTDAEELAFEDIGREDDFSDMWIVLFALLRADWFMAAASSCVWYDEDEVEDVLAQAWKVRT